MKRTYILMGIAMLCTATSWGQDLTDSIARKTQAVSIVTAEEIAKNATPNVSNTLYGLLPGLSVMQQTGWTDDAITLLRGNKAPLIVVDGFVRPISYLHSAEIESVQVLKDGAASSVWGTRGANGVILITTKRGTYNTKMQIEANYKLGMDFPINQPKFANGYEYAAALNEALYYDGLEPMYTREELDAFKFGTNRDLYANTDWMREGLRKHTLNNQVDVTFRGGGSKLRYFAMLNYKNDYGILNESYAKYSDRYTAQMRKYELGLRMNVDIDLTSTTLVQFNLFGQLRERKRPNTNEYDLFAGLYNTPSGAFPMITSNGYWGSNDVLKSNPIARIADVGYYKENPRTLQADLRFRQDLSVLTPGLSAEVVFAYDNSAVYAEEGYKKYQYEVNTPYRNVITDKIEKNSKVYGDNSALQVNCLNMREQYINANVEGAVRYNRSFGSHTVNATGAYRLESERGIGRNNAHKRMYLNASAGYSFRDTYLLHLLVNHTGTSVLPEGDKFRTYPAVSAAWVASNEGFLRDHSVLNLLKLRASYGRSGWDNISYELDRQYWTWGGTYWFGEANNESTGMKEDRLAMRNLTLEISDKYNVGVDLQLFHKLSLTADAFMERRNKMLVSGHNTVSSAIGIGVPLQNSGKVEYKGIDLGIDWKDRLGDHFNYYVGGTFNYLKSEVIENGEGYTPWSYLSGKGHAVDQLFGLEAIGYFRNEADIARSPKQMFSDVRPGDIKYKDMNGDNIIDKHDVHAIGYSSTLPEFYYGLKLGFEYKGFGVDALFQGVARYSKMLNTNSVYWPLRNNLNISHWYLHDQIRWTEETKDIATVPRLTTLNNNNNFRDSSQWLVDGSYFKLRNLNVYYNLPMRWISRIKMEQCQLFVRANNVFSIDHVDYLNCEDFSVNYPDMFSLFVGASIKF